MKKRITIFINGCKKRQGGQVVMVPKKLSELLAKATLKLNMPSTATRLFNRHGGELDEIELIQNDDVLYISMGEDFVDPTLQPPSSSSPVVVPVTNSTTVADHVRSNTTSPKLTRRLRRCSNANSSSNAPVNSEESSVDAPNVTTTVLTSIAENSNTVVDSETTCYITVVPQKSAATVVAAPTVAVPQHAPVLHDAWVRLNVGGRIFVTTRSTLTHNGNNMLSFMFGNDWHSSTDETGAYLIDRSPEYFAPLLNYLRCGRLVLDPGISALNVLEEARFYGLDELEPQLEHLVRQADPDTATFTRKAFASMLLNSNRHSQLRARGLNFEDADLSHLDLSGINFARAKFARADLTGAIFDKCNLQEADLREANLTGASLRGAVMGGANLEGANMRGVNLSSDDIRTNLESANLKNTLLEDAIMSGGSFRCCNFREANLANADLGRSDLAGANFEGANLRGTNLGKTNLKGCNLRLASFDHRTGL